MRPSQAIATFGTFAALLAGCAAPARVRELPRPQAVAAAAAGTDVVQAAATEPGPDRAKAFEAGASEFGADLSPTPGARPAALGLSEWIAVTLERNPRLAQVTWAVEAARGRAVQAGLYPNPTVSVTGDELGDRTGPAGIWTAPLVSQEIVTGNKLGLSQAAAFKEVDQATLDVVAERYRVLTDVRQAYFEVVTLERRAEILAELVGLSGQSVQTVERLLRFKEAVRLDVVQLEVDLERYRAELNATNQSLPGAYRRLAASAGAQDMPVSSVAGSLDLPPPEYNLDGLRGYVLGVHPEVRAAEVGVRRAQILVRRAEVEPIPNVTVSGGFTRQSQNKSNDWDVGVSLPVPVWNRNEGNIFAARAQLGEAVARVGRVKNELVVRLATAHTAYSAARQRADRYRAVILPKAQETYDLSVKAYQGGQFEYLRVFQAQRALAEARLEYVRSLGEMWRAAAELAGLTLEDDWPARPAPREPDKSNGKPNR
jgi:cobalt-zinc-cadmium efflux system outer membrane protein